MFLLAAGALPPGSRVRGHNWWAATMMVGPGEEGGATESLLRGEQLALRGQRVRLVSLQEPIQLVMLGCMHLVGGVLGSGVCSELVEKGCDHSVFQVTC